MKIFNKKYGNDTVKMEYCIEKHSGVNYEF